MKWCFTLMVLSTVAGLTHAEEEPARTYEKLGILMEVSPEMGFLVPQVRKEVRLLNEALIAAKREPVVYHEVKGFAVAPKGSLRIPASRNAVHSLESLIQEGGADGVLWITSLRGEESGYEKSEMGKIFSTGLADSDDERKEKSDAKIPQLILHQIWQGQAQSGFRDVGKEDFSDHLLDEGLMREWVSVIKNSQGYLMRSWWMPDFEAASVFAFPWRVTHRVLLRKLNVGEAAQQYHDTWTSRLRMRYGLEFSRPREVWPRAVTGRAWCEETSLVPRLKSDDEKQRWEKVYKELRARDSIEEDLAMIKADKLGVLFGFGYVKRDLSAAKTGIKRRMNSKQRYMVDLMQIGSEAKTHVEANRARDDRVYAVDYFEVTIGKQAEATDEFYARRMAKMIREEGVDAIYFFTNGYTGSGNYGEFRVNEDLIARAIREAGVRLYVRVPFELGVVPLKLQKLAIASGGGVFFGKSSDPDFDMARPKGEWPEEEN